MFFNDPILYGTTFPYKDLTMQTPFMGQFAPWQKFIPQQFIPQQFPQQFGYANYAYPQVLPFNQQVLPSNQQFVPYNLPYLQHFNYLQHYNLPLQVQQPWNAQIPQHFQMNLPQYGWQRPFVY